MLDQFKSLKGFGAFTAPTGTHSQHKALIDKVSLTITKSAHSGYYSVMFNFGVDVLRKINATRGDKLEVSVDENGKTVAFRKAPSGWTLTGAKRNTSASQDMVSVAEHYIGKTYTKKLKKINVDHMIFGDCIVVDISQLDRLAG